MTIEWSNIACTHVLQYGCSDAMRIGAAMRTGGCHTMGMDSTLEPVQLPADRERLVAFLCGNEWPFHGQVTLTPQDVDRMDFTSTSVSVFWVIDQQRNDVGLVRLFDLDDIGTGAPQIDVRIGTAYRGMGFGSQATGRAIKHLFDCYPEAHRIEAYTRIDNLAMQHVLSASGFVAEGTLRDAWVTNGKEWKSCMVYGILRSDLATES